MPAFQIIPAGPELYPLPVPEVQPFETYGPPPALIEIPVYIPPPPPVAVYGPPPVIETTPPPSGPYPAPVEISSGSTFESDSGVVAVVVTEEEAPTPEPATEAPTTQEIHVPAKEVFSWKKPKVIKIWKPKLVFTKKIIQLPDIWSLLKKH